MEPVPPGYCTPVPHVDPTPSRPSLATSPLDLAVIADVRFATREPHAGGLERHTDTLARELTRLGHTVTVFAGSREELDGHDVPYAIEPLVEKRYEPSDAARADVSMPVDRFMIEHDAYLDVVDHLDRFDAVHNNSLHYLPVVTPMLRPIVHTLHTPPTPWLESAYRVREERRVRRGTAFTNSHVASVSSSNASQWQHHVDQIIHNGVELDRWRPGPGGQYAVWSGRIVPEKGLHLAIEAASRAGIDLLIAGPIHDPTYFDEQIRPRLSNLTSAYLGHLRLDELATLIAGAAVAVVTPCWEEPFGLVAAEALACATPVAAFDRGALAEIVTDQVGALAAASDVAGLARAIVDASGMDRFTCRRRAVDHFSAAVMATRYVSAYVDAGACR